MPIGNGVGNLAQRVNFVPNPFVSIENRAAKMDLETVLLIPISSTMGSAKTGGDTFIVLGAISFWFDIPVWMQTSSGELSRIIFTFSMSPSFHDMLIVGLVSLPRAEIEWSGWIDFSMVILVPLYRVYFRREPE